MTEDAELDVFRHAVNCAAVLERMASGCPIICRAMWSHLAAACRIIEA